MPETIGTAYVQIEPSFEGVSSKINKEMGDAGTQSGKTFGAGFATFGKVAAGAVVAAGAGITKLATDAVKAYSNFEQLEGGIETLFGDAAPKVMANAESAFMTAGQSMNDYMETSIQSAAALINSLDGDTSAAADMMDMSITDMADNVNKMGTTMEAVQNAYRGFSRGNFSMLDNLALGFAGTKEGMQELLDKATELSGVEYDIDSYADIVEAIHVVQTDMGITGTTAKEAAETISGSMASLEAAWTNVITGIADENADFEGQIDSFVDTASTFADNLLPRIEVAIGGISQLISKLAPKIISELPGLFQKIAPEFLSAIVSLITSLVEQAPALVDSLLSVVTMALNELNNSLPSLIPIVISAILQIIDSILGYLPEITSGLLTLITSVADSLLSDGLPLILAVLPEIISQIVFFITDSTAQLISATALIIQSIAEALPLLINTLIPVIPELVLSIIEALIKCGPQLGAAFIELLSVLFAILPEIQGKIWAEIPKVGMEIIKVFKSKIPDLKEAALDAMTKFVEAMAGSRVFAKISSTFREIWSGIKNNLKIMVDGAKTWGQDMINNFINGIKDKISSVVDAVSDIANTVKDYLGFSEPKKGPLSNFHTYAPDMMDLFAKGITDNEDMLKATVTEAFDFQGSIESGYATPQDDGSYQETVLSLLQTIANNAGVQIDVNSEGLFNLVRSKNNEYSKRTGRSAFA